MEILFDTLEFSEDYSEILVDCKTGEWILRTENNILVPISDETAEALVERWKAEMDGNLH